MFKNSPLPSMPQFASRCGALAYAAFLVAVISCGGDERMDARDEATQASCAYFTRCNEVGPSGMFKTRDECEVKQRAYWEDTWPTASCDKRIDPAAVSACLTEIDLAQCGNALDFFSALDKCQRSRVCSL